MSEQSAILQSDQFDPAAIRAVIFDFDGTLAETDIDFGLMRRRVLEVAEQWGLRDHLDERRYILEIVEDSVQMLPEDGDRERFREEAARAMREVELTFTSVASPFPGVPETLERLRQCGHRVGIVTRNCRAGVQSVFSRHPMEHEVLLTRDDVERVKPDPAHLHEALDALEVAPEYALMVGDHITDIEVGHAAGTWTAGVLTAKTTREQFEEIGAHLVLPSAAHVTDALCLEEDVSWMEHRLPVGKLEPEFLATLLNDLHIDDSRVIVGPGIGRDVTVLEWGRTDSYLIAKTDPITFATDEIGHYAVAVNTNDVATSGGVPLWFLATLLLPDDQSDDAMVESIFRQVDEACGDLDIALVGGHTEVTYDLDRPILVGFMLGEVRKDELVTSEGAQVGDRILLTKRVCVEGTSIIAREVPQRLAEREIDEDAIDRAKNLLHDPGINVLREARVAVGAGEVHAMHDPTEGGVATGLHELAIASETGIAVALDDIPFFAETESFCDVLGVEPLGLIASGSLLLAVAPDDSETIAEAIRAEGIDCADIGEVVEEDRGVKIRRGLNWHDLPRYDQDEIAKVL